MLKTIFLLGLLLLFYNCGRKPVFKKVVSDSNITVSYFVYSDIGNVSADHLEIYNNKSKEMISLVRNIDDKIIDLWIQNDSIFIEHKPLSEKNELVRESCFGYTLIYIELSSYEYFKREKKKHLGN